MTARQLTRRAFVLSGLAAFLAACSPAPKLSKPEPIRAPDSSEPSIGQARLLWSEEFTSLDLATPEYPLGFWRANDVGQPLAEGYIDFGSGHSWCLNPNQVLAGAPRSAFAVKDSVLTISSFRTPESWREDIQATAGSVPDWCGGLLVSNSDLRTFGYGYYEFRARWPNRGPGMFPALWFYAAEDQNPGNQSAEIDLFEIFGYGSGQPWTTTLHQQGVQQRVGDQSTDIAQWHRYGLDWTADHVAVYLDGLMVCSSTNVSGLVGARMTVRLNYAMDAGYFPGEDRSSSQTPSPLLMEVDYVRLYDKPPA